jgi:hypothetical protein
MEVSFSPRRAEVKGQVFQETLTVTSDAAGSPFHVALSGSANPGASD